MVARPVRSYQRSTLRRQLLPAIALLIGLPIVSGTGNAQYSTTGRWTTLPNDIPDSSWDTMEEHLHGRGTHMALLRGANNESWVIHWHLGQQARLWKAVPGVDISLAFDVPLPVDTSQIFCAGHSILADSSKLLVVGGTLNVGQDDIGTTGTNKTVAFNPYTHKWSVMDTMTYERWYPTSTALGDGRALTTSGSSFYYLSVFGGRQANALRSDVRLISGAKYPAWENDVTAGNPPGAREGHTNMMTTNFSIVWGGRTGPSHTDTASVTWVYFLVSTDSDTGKVWDWSRIETVPDPIHGRPTPRAWHSSAMIDTDLVVYGGRSRTGVLGDVWKLKGVPYGTRTWKKISVAPDEENGPAPSRFRHSAALDYQPPSDDFTPWARPRWIIQGGRLTDSLFAPPDLWELRFVPKDGVLTDSAEWRLISPGGGAGPGQREGHVAVFDRDIRLLRTDTRRIFFHGGHRFVFGGSPAHELRSDVWILSRAATDTNYTTSATWTEASFTGAVPGKRRRQAATYNLHWHEFRMFGGDTTLNADTLGGESDAMWAFSLRPASNQSFTWRQIVAKNAGASARFGHSLVDEQSDERHIFSHRSELFVPQPGAQGDWSVMDNDAARRYMEWYPMMFLLRSGKLFFPGNARRAPGDESSVLNLGDQTWSHRQFAKFSGGSAILLPINSVPGDSDYVAKLGAMSNGGCVTCPAEGRVAIAAIDSSTGYTTWRISQAMPEGEKRKYQNVTLLPDGTSLVTGGFDGTGELSDGSTAAPAQRKPRIWNMTWGPALEEEPFQRGYHSTALLLPDGRVLSASGEQDGNPGDFPNAAVFWPPYLFNGNSLAVRPGVWGATDTIGYNKSFWICTNNPDSVKSVALIRPGSVTHGFNMDQRYVPLKFTKHQGLLRLQATSPVDSNLAPPGDYMLFIVNMRGVPSIAKWVNLRRGNSSANPDCGGGCPFLDTRTASGWEVENSILGRSANGAPVQDAYRLKSSPTVINGRYQLRIREDEQELTTLDQVRLVAVDHAPEVRAWPFKDRAMLGAWTAPVRVTTSDGTDVTHLLDGNSESFFVGESGETLLVDLTQNASGATIESTLEGRKVEETKSEVAAPPPAPSGGSIPEENDLDPFEIDDGGKGGGGGGGLMAGGLESIQRNVDAQVLASSGLLIQGRDAEGTWRTVRQRYPREHFDGFLVDTLDQGPVRIVFVGRHKLRRVGRVIPTETAIPTTLPLVAARHSRLGTISGEVLDSGGETTMLTPGDTLALEFTATPVPEGQVRDFFLLTRGVYSSSNPGIESNLLGGVQPLRFALLQNQPNPFSTATSIHFELARAEKVRIEIFDPQGRLVRRLADRRYEAGQWEIDWNRRSSRGNVMPPGIYLYRMVAGSFRSQRKMVVLP